MRLSEITPLEGGREYMTAHWMTDEHKAMIRPESDWADKEAFLGDKYDWYAGFGHCIRPKSIFEVGVFMGYSIATMIWGAKKSVERVVLLDISEQVHNTGVKVINEFHGFTVETLCYDSKNVDMAKLPSPFDIVHIDGDHTYEYAHNDLFKFGPMVSQNGLIVVDDAKDPAVYRACCEFKEAFDMESRYLNTYNGHVLLQRKQ